MHDFIANVFGEEAVKVAVDANLASRCDSATTTSSSAAATAGVGSQDRSPQSHRVGAAQASSTATSPVEPSVSVRAPTSHVGPVPRPAPLTSDRMRGMSAYEDDSDGSDAFSAGDRAHRHATGLYRRRFRSRDSGGSVGGGNMPSSLPLFRDESDDQRQRWRYCPWCQALQATMFVA